MCCSVSCGQCGKPGCSSLDAGGDSCCTANVLDSGVLCSDSGAAPCIIDEGMKYKYPEDMYVCMWASASIVGRTEACETARLSGSLPHY